MIWVAWGMVMGGVSAVYGSGVEGGSDVIHSSDAGIFLR